MRINLKELSFAALLADDDEETWKDEIFATVAHEFTTTWRIPPASTPWTTRTRSSSARPGRSMGTRSERSAAGFVKK